MFDLLKTSIFDGPQINKFLEDTNFVKTTSEKEALTFKKVCKISWGNTKL